MFTWSNKRFVFIILFFSMVSLWGQHVEAKESEPIILDASTDKIDVYPAIDMIKDQDGQLTIDDVVSEAFSKRFIPEAAIEKKIGFFEMSNWLRFEVNNQSVESEWLLEFAFPLIHELEIYTIEEGEVVELQKAGADYPFHQREIAHRNFVFPIDVKPGTSKVFYVLAVGSGDLHPPIKIWDRDTFIKKTEKEYMLLGIFYGIIIVMILYNLLLYFSLRLKSYLYYVIVITCTLLGKLSINGLGYQYIWPNAPAWNLISASFWVAMACIFILIFTRNFLNTDDYIPSFKKVMYLLIPLNMSVILLVAFFRYVALYIMVIAAILTFTAVLTAAIICLKRGAREARFYVVGWLIFLSGVTVTILERTVIFPYSIITEYAGQAALSMEVVLLSLALADKMNIMRHEKEAAEKTALDSQELALKNLKKADALKDEFLAVTSHELRTPLYGMIGIAESLRDGIAGDVSGDMKKQLAMIITSGNRLTRLVNGILDFSKLKYESLELDLKPVHVKGIVDMIIGISTVLVKQKPIHLINKTDDTLPPVWADENRFQQILYNLIENAVKYTEEGEIVISASVEEKHLVIHIEDTGMGITKKDLPFLFDPFQQGEASLVRDASGIGIGLSITKKLVDLHQGSITVQSKVGVGSRFSVCLPIYDKAESNELVSVNVSDSQLPLDEQLELLYTAPKRTKDKATILIADDEMINLQVLLNQLSLHDYHVITASRGEEVLAIVREQDIDLLIVDIMMPGMSGYEVCQRIRTTYTLMELPILMLTAKNQVQDKLISFEVGANDYVVKTCDKQEFLSRVKTLVEVKRLNQNLVEMNLHLEERIQMRTKDLQAANKELERINKELVSMTASRRRLLANISHDLGTPVTLIHSYMQSLQSGLITRDDPYYGNLVFDKLKVLTRLADDLYNLSKKETGNMSLYLQEVGLLEWLEQVYYKSEYTVLQAGRQVEKELPSVMYEQVICLVDIDRMDQLFSNLITNAIKHTQPKTGRIMMKTKVMKDGRLSIQISDNGTGISEGDLPYIFDRFYKKDSLTEGESGMGLGLSIVKEIVEGHHGEIKVESKVNEGTRVSIILPLKNGIIQK